uniref:CIDE-N domain-containing protein n=1 Tax=Chrysemys picta bellii TaxID=8478 RepID=A0A8C3IT76_CHRPI
MLPPSPPPPNHDNGLPHTKRPPLTPSPPRSVSSAGSELTRRVWAPRAPPQRPFRVCNQRRGGRTGLMAGTLQELLAKAMEALLVAGLARLVLEEDGTAVESEAFFQTLPPDTALMLLGPGQSWSPPRVSEPSPTLQTLTHILRERPRQGQDIARITFDVYKLGPRDLFGSLNVKATFYGLYSMSCDFKCLGPKKVLRWVTAPLPRLLPKAPPTGRDRTLLLPAPPRQGPCPSTLIPPEPPASRDPTSAPSQYPLLAEPSALIQSSRISANSSLRLVSASWCRSQSRRRFTKWVRAKFRTRWCPKGSLRSCCSCSAGGTDGLG